MSAGTPNDGTSTGRFADPVDLANEFALVRLRIVDTANGARLEIDAPRRNRTIRLCPLELESLTWQTSETFSGFLANPLGEDDAVGWDDDEGMDP